MYNSQTKKLTIGLDFDDTVTRNIPMFKAVARVMFEYGCDIYIVTARQQNGWCEKLRQFHEDTCIPVIFTSTKAKHDVAEIDIWIDDFPLAITHDFKETRWTPSETTKKGFM